MHIKTLIGSVLAGLLVSGTALAAEAGLRMITVPGTEPIPVALFYPSQSETRNIPMGPFLPRVAFNGDPAASVKGLILISHGTGGSELGHHNLAQRLAQDGYLVAAVQHPRDNYRDRSLVSTGAFFSERPKQVSRVLDALLTDPEWKEKIPAGHIGAVGHSAGGFTVLALAGGIANPQRLASHCTTPANDAVFCGLGRKSGAAQPAMPALKPADFDVMDKRIRAVIAMAPVGVVFAQDSLQRINVPLKIYTAEHDAVLSGKYHGGWLHGELPKAGFEEVKNAGHFAFMAPMTKSVAADAGDPNGNPPGFDRGLFHQRLEHEVSTFFERHLQ